MTAGRGDLEGPLGRLVARDLREVERLDGRRDPVNRAYLVLVALDEQGHPTPVPGLLLETESERAEWEAGERRQELRKTRRQEGY